MIPVRIYVLLELHILKRLGNKIQTNFLGILHKRIEVMPTELILKQNMTVIAIIGLKLIENEFKESTESLNNKVEIRKSFTTAHKNCQLDLEQKAQK